MWLVRSDIGPRPAWLHQQTPKLDVPWRAYEVTEDEKLAHRFLDKDAAERIAWLWSDVPGVWNVVAPGAGPAKPAQPGFAVINCCTCGRFMTCAPGASWQMVYSGHPPTPDHERFQCKSCTEKHGPLTSQDGIRPECGAGVFK